MGYPKKFMITVNITQSDIDHGEKFNCITCPGARATLRKLAKLGLDVVNIDKSSATAGKLRKGAKLSSVSVDDDGKEPYFMDIELNYPSCKSQWLRRPFYECTLPHQMYNWIDRFDDEEHVEPASFTLVFSRVR